MLVRRPSMRTGALAPGPRYARAMSKTYWQGQRGGRQVYVQIAGEQVVVGQDTGDRHGDSATSTTRQQFLDGRLQDLVRDYIGDEGLAEVLAELRDRAE